MKEGELTEPRKRTTACHGHWQKICLALC